MFSFKPFTSLYDFFSSHRMILYVCTSLLVLSSAFVLKDMRLTEDITSMLPDGQSGKDSDFGMLQKAPLIHKIIINLQAGPGVSRQDLIEASDRLAGVMSLPFFGRVVSGPGENADPELLARLVEMLPNIATDKDLDRISGDMNPEGIRAKLNNMYNQLIQVEGYIFKDLMRSDPLELRFIALEKLRFLNFTSGMQLYHNHFLSEDGRNTLIIADTPISITDSRGSEELLDHFQGLVDDVIPSEVKVTFISGHRYTADNTRAIKRDVIIVLAFSTIAILVLFLVWLRSLRALIVFFVPVISFCIASAGVSLFYDSVSAITIGFGSVLLGISVDFALHIYFALRRREQGPEVILGEVSRPVLFGGLTTILAFSVLLCSDLPGQRQLAVFSMIGMAAALIISLIVMPHLMGSGKPDTQHRRRHPTRRFHLHPRAVICIWIVILVFCAYNGRKLHFDGDLGSLNMISKGLRSAEYDLGQIWGNFRGSAMIFSRGEDLQTSLEKNDLLFECLAGRPEIHKIVSIAPIFPSIKVQQRNREHWGDFWSKNRDESIRQLLIKEGRPLGFSSVAFDPFYKRLSEQERFISRDELRILGLGDLIDSMIIKSDESVQVMTLIPDTPELLTVVSKECEDIPDVRLLSQTRFGEIIGKAVAEDFADFIIRASVLVVFMIVILFRNLKKALNALVPVFTGLIFMFGIMGWLQMSFNLFNIIATILIIGLGVDYGIFIVCKISEQYDHDTNSAVLISGLSTIAGFGALVLARHPALHSIGVTVLLGIGAAIPTALLVVPALYKRG